MCERLSARINRKYINRKLSPPHIYECVCVCGRDENVSVYISGQHLFTSLWYSGYNYTYITYMHLPTHTAPRAHAVSARLSIAQRRKYTIYNTSARWIITRRAREVFPTRLFLPRRLRAVQSFPRRLTLATDRTRKENRRVRVFGQL